MSLAQFLETTEKDVQGFLAKIATGVEVVIEDVQAATQWIVNNSPTILADIEAATTFAQAVGGSDPDVQKVAADAKAASDALSAYVADSKSGDTQIQAVVDGYLAFANGAAAAATVKATSTKAVAASPNATQAVSPPTPNEG